ncbi:hypothetical protein V6S67_19610 [Arthrobacter sp. Soc17.1.1.1]|uniref:hypothetical protein n=1 Tax=Arthrobacter sp. Soc17.1.1.1 TaxID=3121277 RepID=UPI002FE46A5A
MKLKQRIVVGFSIPILIGLSSCDGGSSPTTSDPAPSPSESANVVPTQAAVEAIDRPSTSSDEIPNFMNEVLGDNDDRAVNVSSIRQIEEADGITYYIGKTNDAEGFCVYASTANDFIGGCGYASVEVVSVSPAVESELPQLMLVTDSYSGYSLQESGWKAVSKNILIR